MTMYRFNWRYSSGLGVGDKGDEIDLTTEEADLYNRDSPGVLSPVKGAKAEAETKSVDEPPADRMVKTAAKRTDEPITKETFKAVKNP